MLYDDFFNCPYYYMVFPDSYDSFQFYHGKSSSLIVVGTLRTNKNDSSYGNSRK